MALTHATHAKDMAIPAITERMILEAKKHMLQQSQIGVEA